MPVYEYACTACGERLEVRQSFTDEPLTVCPECAGRLRKVLSAVGVVFKGSGFYRTDSRSENKSDGGAKVGASSGGDGAASSSSGNAKSDSSSSKSDSSSSKSESSSSAGSGSSSSSGSGGSSGAKAAS